MKYAREKKKMLAWLALLAPLPLPFSDSLEWPVLFLYAFFLIFFLQRVERGERTVLPNWVLNLLGLLYLPLLYIDLQASVVRSSPVTALIHLIMFLILVKLYSMRKEKDKWHLMIASFFLFVGGMATSTHITVGFYLLFFMMLTMMVLARFAYLHMAATQERLSRPGAKSDPPADESPAGAGAGALWGARILPYRTPLLLGTVLIVAIAIPTFATLPRLREPFILGPGGGAGGLIRTTGFSDSVDLSLTSSIRGNRNVVLRLKFSGSGPEGDEMRFKGATYDRYENRRWHRLFQHSKRLSPVLDERNGRLFRINERTSYGQVEIFRERMRSRGLLLPMEAVAVAIEMPTVQLDLGGATFLPAMPSDTLRYVAFLAAEPQIEARLEPLTEGEVSPFTALDQSGITDRMRDLAREAMGEGTPGERVDRLERFLMSRYSYTTDFVGREGETPLEDFLFKYESGHCELFASSMVLLLRAENIPARLSTGFLGAEYNPLEGYYMVRQESAHAWVEAYTPERGWRVYDPTPPEGRPVLPERGLGQLMSQFYDYLTFRWDRYVLTYGADDQRSFFETVRLRLAELWRELTSSETGEETRRAEAGGGVEASRDDVIREPELWLNKIPRGIAIALFVCGLAGLFAWQRRRLLTGEVAYRRLRRRLERSGLKLSAALAPLELQDLAIARYPSAAPPMRSLMALYLRESFAESPLAANERARLRDHLREAFSAMRQEDKGRRRTKLTPRRDALIPRRDELTPRRDEARRRLPPAG